MGQHAPKRGPRWRKELSRHAVRAFDATESSRDDEMIQKFAYLLQAGMLVEHLKFGVGKIIQIDNESGNKKAVVFFKSVGQKQLLLKFAKLKIIN